MRDIIRPLKKHELLEALKHIPDDGDIYIVDGEEGLIHAVTSIQTNDEPGVMSLGIKDDTESLILDHCRG